MSAGLYLKLIRERRRISRAKVAEQLNVSEQTVWNIEHWAKDPASSVLFAFVDAIQASMEDIGRLLRNAADDEGEARRLAEMRLTDIEQHHINAVSADPRTAEIARRLLEDPAFYDALARAAMERIDP